MDAMHEALKRKMMAMKHGKGHPQPQDALEVSGDEEEKEGLDQAPDLKGGDAMHELMIPAHAVEEEEELEGHPEHMKIIAALADGGHGGAGSLHSRVADKAKEKFASISKHKKGIA